MLRTTSIESLPEHIILDILVRIPAQDICNAAIFVCRMWHRMIRTRVFVHAHLQQSTPDGLFVHENRGCRQPIFLKGQIEISNMNCEFASRVMSSCNGLVLEPLGRGLHVTNPTTKQHFALPLFNNTRASHDCCGIAYAAAEMKYKVVCLFYSPSPLEIECAILTVGVDTDWERRVNTQHLPLASSQVIPKLHNSQPPLTTQGFVHWANIMYPDFLSLNVETEIITQNSVPAVSCLGYYYLAMGSNLSVLIAQSRWLWEVWELRPETGEWTQMLNIDLEPHYRNLLGLSKLKHLGSGRYWFQPVGWSSFREVLLFRVYPPNITFHVAYNVRTQQVVWTDQLNLNTYFLAHKNTLAWL